MNTNHTGGMARAAGRSAMGCAGSAAGIIAIAIVSFLLISSLINTFDPLERDRRSSQYYRDERLQNDLYSADVAAGYAWRLAPALGATVLCTGGAWVLLMIGWRQYADWRTIHMDRRIRMARALTQKFPEGLQTLAFHDSSKAAPMLAEPAFGDDPNDLVAQIEDGITGPPFETLLAEFGPGKPRVLGRDVATGDLVRLSTEELFNIAIGGTSGSGKSWTIAAIAAQHILAGGKLIIIDPHGRKDDGLTKRLQPFAPAFFCKPAIDEPDMKAMADMVRAEVKRRKEGKRGKPWLVVVDEYAALMRSAIADTIGGMVEELGQEGRGFGITAICGSQVWNSARAGGSEVRDAFSSQIVHRIRPTQARMLTGMYADSLPHDLHNLPRGVFYLFDTSGDIRRVVAPWMSAEAMNKVAELLTSEAPRLATIGYPQATGETIDLGDLVASCKPDGSLMVAKPELSSAAAASDGSPTADAARAARLFLEGSDLPAIVAELRGVKSSEGRRYQDAAREVQALIRAGMAGGTER